MQGVPENDVFLKIFDNWEQVVPFKGFHDKGSYWKHYEQVENWPENVNIIQMVDF